MASQRTVRGSEAEQSAKGRVIRHLMHGGHVLEAQSGEAKDLIATQESIAAPSQAGLAFGAHVTCFDYLFEDLAASWPDAHLPTDDPAATADALRALGAAMVEDAPDGPDPLTQPDNSNISPIYTYWGQFIDHDMTAATDSDTATISITADPFVPQSPDVVEAAMHNARHPALNLDSIYGGGPATSPELYDGIRLKVGDIALEADAGKPPIQGDPVAPEGDLAHDLPRAADGTAVVGDGRNDENLVVAQLHVAFLRFHNAVVEWVAANEPQYTTDDARFERARNLVRWHYGWLVVHDFLPTLTLPGVAEHVLYGDTHLYEPDPDRPCVPLEYAVAAYRFGHSMVRGFYDYNRNFGRPGTVQPNASFGLLFAFTGNAPTPPGPFLGATRTLPFNWVIEWDRFVDRFAAFPDHFARKIDTRLAPPLRDLSNHGNEPGLEPPIRQILKRLATRNLLRGYLLALPTGQQVAQRIGATPLTEQELGFGNPQAVNDALQAGGFLERTPLWFYVLKEAEIQADGNSLGEVGSRIVCETIIGQVRADPDSYLNLGGGFTPTDGVRLSNGPNGAGEPIVSIADLLRFAGTLT